MKNELKLIKYILIMVYENRQETIEYFTHKIPRKELENNHCRSLQNLYSNHVSYMWRQ
jgi:hypothetical protein